MNEEFIKRIYSTVVLDGLEAYKEQFNNTIITDKSTDYAVQLLQIYSLLSKKQKEVFLNFIQVVIIDTISTMFGIFDGSSTLNGGNYDIDIKIDGKDTDKNLQDPFLLYVEENE